MTQEAKAQELYQKMKPSVIDDDPNEQVWWHAFAQSRAAICCDEIIDTYSSSFSPQRKYWEDVKKQIESITM